MEAGTSSVQFDLVLKVLFALQKIKIQRTFSQVTISNHCKALTLTCFHHDERAKQKTFLTKFDSPIQYIYIYISHLLVLFLHLFFLALFVVSVSTVHTPGF
jgi:hypothetical protein